jgi:hypothetical protein
MCFSATASFTTAVVLLPAGIYCVKKAAGLEKPYWLFALMPLMFGMQQLFEGVVWLGMEADHGGTKLLAARGYLFFSHLFWLFWIPLSCYAVEDNMVRRKIYFFLAILGALHGSLLYVPLLFNEDWVTVKLVGHSLKYKMILFHEDYLPLLARNSLYAVLTLVPLLSASDRYIKVFGVLIVISLALTNFYYEYAFVSVWCFFAAILSIYLVVMIIIKTRVDENRHMIGV